jgi:hypothetical protein
MSPVNRERAQRCFRHPRMGRGGGMDVVPEHVLPTFRRAPAWSADVGETKALWVLSGPFGHRGNVDAMKPNAMRLAYQIGKVAFDSLVEVISEPARLRYRLVTLRANFWCYAHIGNIGHKEVGGPVRDQFGQDVPE